MIKALRSCRFAGKDYSAGETIPASAIDEKAIGALKMLKIIEVRADDLQLQPKPNQRRRAKPTAV